MPTKLHELLAVQDSLDKQAQQTTTQLKDTFKNKRHLFEEKIVTFQPFEENAKSVTESQSSIQSTVKSEVKWISEYLAKQYDIEYQIDEANTAARADVIDDAGNVVANLKNIPATTLLQLEKELAFLREFILTIPTLDPAKGFKPDADRGDGYYRANDVHKTRTRKVEKPVVGYAATKEHPAQVKWVTSDEPTGTITEQEWSAMITPALKADLMSNVENLIRWVKRARSRANEVEVDVRGFKIGQRVLDFVFEPLK